jgi:hypothetical protein
VYNVNPGPCIRFGLALADVTNDQCQPQPPRLFASADVDSYTILRAVSIVRNCKKYQFAI